VTDGTAGLCGAALPAAIIRRSMGGDTRQPEEVVTVRPVRILLVAIALIAAGLTGWVLGTRDDNPQPSADPAVTAVTEAPPAAPSDPAPQRDAAPGVDTPAGDVPGTTQPAPKPRILGFGSEPVFPRSGGFWQLPPGPGDVILVTDAEHASKVEFLLTPTGTGVGDLAVRIGQDSNGRDGYMVRWRYKVQPLLAHLTVRATGPGGTAEKVVGVHHADPVVQP
jgi:hypothetical protein